MRDKVSHNYSIDSGYALAKGCPERHLNQESSGCKVICIEVFVQDVFRALDRFIVDLEKDKRIRSNALRVVKEHGVLSMATMDFVAETSNQNKPQQP